MLVRLKALTGALALDEFTVSALARYAGIKEQSVRTVLGRQQDLFEEIRKEKTGRPGGSTIVYRLKRDRIPELEHEIDELYGSLPPKYRGDETESAALALDVAEEFLTRHFQDTRDIEKREEILAIATKQIESVRQEMPTASPEVTDKINQRLAALDATRKTCVELVETQKTMETLRERIRAQDRIARSVVRQHKSQFLANMSHELRTPLNAILGYTELIADGIYGEPSEKMLGVLKRLESNGKHLLGLINDLLDLSKIETGQLVLELSDYSLEDIAQTVRSTLEPLAADKKLAFKVEMAPKMPPGHGDGRRLTQVMINLVSNAIKFTDAGEVVITGGTTGGSFHLSVRDTGPGISAADQAKLFQEFQQADDAVSRKKGGTGLGLAISRRIIEMHGGKIRVESQVGQGSTFSLTVPVRVAQQVATP